MLKSVIVKMAAKKVKNIIMKRVKKNKKKIKEKKTREKNKNLMNKEAESCQSLHSSLYFPQNNNHRPLQFLHLMRIAIAERSAGCLP